MENHKPVEASRTLIPHLVVKDAVKTMAWYQQALGAEEMFRSPGPDGRIMHASMKLGDCMFMLNDEFPEMGARSPATLGGTAVVLNVNFTKDKIDQAWKRAVDAGAKVAMPIANQFWGDRYGILEDASGHRWAFCAHVEDLSKEEIEKRAQASMYKGNK